MLSITVSCVEQLAAIAKKLHLTLKPYGQKCPECCRLVFQYLTYPNDMSMLCKSPTKRYH